MSHTSIVCVDDERIVLSSLKDQLRRHFGKEITIESAESAAEGLEVFEELRAERYDVPLVISDQLMPGMKGEEFLAEVHAIDPKTLTVLLTGQATVEAVGKAVNTARLYRFLGKPWEETDLVLTVREALHAYQQSREIERKNDELRAAHDASTRFVPQEFLQLLGRQHVVDVTFGDHVEREMSMFLSDIRSYTTIIEGKTPAEAFEFINQHMQMMEAPVRSHGGFIGNIEGDSMLALFPGGADDAVRAGIMCHKALTVFNQSRTGPVPVAMGLGVNSGRLLLGTIGGKERLQCDVVGDAINVCSRIEGLTKLYNTAMLLSESVYAQLASPAAYNLRLVDCVRVKGKTTPVTIYEVLDVLPQHQAAAKTGLNRAFLQARELFCTGRIEDAKFSFQQLLAKAPDDGAVQLYIKRCDYLLAHGLPHNWNGIVDLDFK